MYATPVQIVNDAQISDRALARVERSVAAQVNGPVYRAWGARVRFVAKDGELVELGSTAVPLGYDGWHWFGTLGTSTAPHAAIRYNHWWTETMSHEIIEMLVDPDGTHPEVCDPAERYGWVDRWGVLLSAFVNRRGQRVTATTSTVTSITTHAATV